MAYNLKKNDIMKRIFKVAYYNKGNPFMLTKNVEAKSIEEVEKILQDNVDFDRIEYILLTYEKPDNNY